jgi:hypothetical protein
MGVGLGVEVGFGSGQARFGGWRKRLVRKPAVLRRLSVWARDTE